MLNPSVAATQKEPTACGTRVLTELDWLAPVVALHELVRAEMPDNQRHFLLPKPPEYFRALLTGKTGVLLGAFVNGDLIGSMALVWAETFAAALAAGRITYPDTDGRLTKLYRKGGTAVIQAMGLRNIHSGHGLSRSLLQAAIGLAGQRGCSHLCAQVAEQNALSWLRFLDQDFAIIAAWTGGHRRYLLRWLSSKDRAKLIRRSAPGDRLSFSKDYAQLPALLAQVTSVAAQGRIVFINNQQNESGALSFVFGHASF
jgi:GNAT superfamily N-acetyltransferase